MSDKDVDAQFADIIAHWDDVAAVPDGDRPAPAAGAPDDGYAAGPAPEDEPPAGDEPPRPRSAVNPPLLPNVNPPLRPREDPSPVPLERPFVVWRGAVPPADDDADTGPSELAADEEDEHFEPGPTAPLPPQEDLQFWGIIVGLVAGPLLLLWLVLFRPDVSGWWTAGALGLTIGGFVLLVLRQPHHRDEDDPDNGARV